MDNLEAKPTHSKLECVQVAVNIRPLIQSELLVGCTDCITVAPGEPQVQIGAHSFTYDHVYGGSASPSSRIYDDCIAPLVDAIFHGYNATVLAYGQTGSGKTYTMGTNYTGEADCGGIIPKVMEAIFKKVDEMKANIEFLIRVSFIEIFKEEVFDLLDSSTLVSRGEGPPSLAKPAVSSRTPIQIRETPTGGITMAGVTEAEVNSKEEMASYLARGSISRATGSTNMNSQSSRSHAIFTISIEQKRSAKSCGTEGLDNEACDDIIFAKFHLVDLAGSERAKRTGADGLRLKEGIHINRGLLALGNVISALGDEKKRKEGAHVPYRDSKLTRLLQDSLGGNSKTVMIACVSPADTNAEETINTLKYANRARNIQNKAVVNHDPVTTQMQKMRTQLEQLQSELLYFRNGGAPLEELQVLRHRISLLEASNAELHQELKERQTTCERLAQRALDSQVERDELMLKIESFRGGKPWSEIDNSSDKMPEADLVRGYLSKIQDLETELFRLQSFSTPGHNGFMACLDLDDDGLSSKDTFLPALRGFPCSSDNKFSDVSAEIESDEKEREHSTLREKFDRELQELEVQLEQKEAEMRRFSKTDTSVLKQHYEKKILELEHEKKALQKEIENLRSNLANISSVPEDGTQNLKEEYLQKLNILEAQVSELKKKQEAQSQLLRQKQKSDDAAKRLQEEIQRIKSQKVQLQHKIKQESEQFRLWKASREKEVLQLKKEGRRNEYEMHKLLALNQRQKMVLQRKTEEASLATKRLKELLEGKKASSRENLGIQALMQAIEHELEVVLGVHEVRSKYKRQLEARTIMANELMKLKDDAEMLKQTSMCGCNEMMSPSARSSRILALENMLATSSSTLVSMASHLSEAEERERLFSGKNRWNQVRSLAEAKNLLNHLFNKASSSRCELQDKDVTCLEKDTIIKELKEKVLRLTSLLRQSEAQKIEMHQKLQELEAKKLADVVGSFGSHTSNTEEDGCTYGLRKDPRRSQIFNNAGNILDLQDDMDTSDSEESNLADPELDDLNDQDWVESGKKMAVKRAKTRNRPGKSSVTEVHCPEDVTLGIMDEAVQEGNCESESCCSCSRASTCKTKKCECRASGNLCGTSCGCRPFKCANREENSGKELDELLEADISKNQANHSSMESIADKNMELASHGAMLLQSAFNKKHMLVDEEMQRRKPLSDIGNTVAMTNAAKPSRRKNWRKSVVQLVPVATVPPQSETDYNEPPKARDDLILRLPRAMVSQPLNNQPLGERNSIMADEHAENKGFDTGTILPKSPPRLQRGSNEKENHMV